MSNVRKLFSAQLSLHGRLREVQTQSPHESVGVGDGEVVMMLAVACSQVRADVLRRVVGGRADLVLDHGEAEAGLHTGLQDLDWVLRGRRRRQ